MKDLIDEVREPGDFVIQWDGRDMGGGTAMSGVYFYDVQGRLVRKLLDGQQKRGGYSFRWDGRDTSNREVQGGSTSMISLLLNNESCGSWCGSAD